MYGINIDNNTIKNIIYIIVFLSIVVIVIYLFLIKLPQDKNVNLFLAKFCKKGNCPYQIAPCKSLNAYQYVETKNEKKIERKTYKCILEPDDKNKLLKLDYIFKPSMMNGSYCDMLYTTYYDYEDLTVMKNRINQLNLPISKCIRIRHYHFNPNIYLEIKYPGGTKIRALINKQYELLEPEKIDEQYRELLIDLIDKIKNNSIKPIFNNTYKRLSFIYKNNPDFRITLDTNIEFFHNNLYHHMKDDILEIKIPTNISVNEANNYLSEINKLAGTKLMFKQFSKFEYYYYNIILSNENVTNKKNTKIIKNT